MAEDGMSEEDAARLQALLGAEDEEDELDYSAPAPAPEPAPVAPPAAPESQVEADAALARKLATATEGDEALARAIQASLADAAPPAPAEESAAAGEAEWARQLAALEAEKAAPPPHLPIRRFPR